MLLATRALLPPAASWGTLLKTAYGVHAANDMISFIGEDGQVCEGIARRFLCVPAATGTVQFYALLTQLLGAGAARYAVPRDDAADGLVIASRLRGTCCDYRRGDFLHVVMQRWRE